jgi:hypothetical protein
VCNRLINKHIIPVFAPFRKGKARGDFRNLDPQNVPQLLPKRALAKGRMDFAKDGKFGQLREPKVKRRLLFQSIIISIDIKILRSFIFEFHSNVVPLPLASPPLRGGRGGA